MKKMSISELRSRLPEVIDQVQAGRESVLVTRHGKPVASIGAPKVQKAGREARYPLRGLPVEISSDFDQPLPELWSAIDR